VGIRGPSRATFEGTRFLQAQPLSSPQPLDLLPLAYWEIHRLESISDPREPVRLISKCSSLPQHDVDVKDWAVDGESILVVRTRGNCHSYQRR
jgi:hypothetical protein